MNFSDLHFIETQDGSYTLGFSDIDEHYHSINGAIQESMHVYINAALKDVNLSKKKIQILEIGFGTGLNAFLSLLYAKRHHIEIQYTSLEAFPLQEEVYSRLNYSQIVNADQNDFLLLHTSKWNNLVEISPFFTLAKYNTKVEMFNYPENTFDVVYFDAFAPRFQPELWTDDIFKKIFYSMTFNSVLTTYCCKGDVKRILQNVGFNIEKIPGFKGKREMLRAWKK